MKGGGSHQRRIAGRPALSAGYLTLAVLMLVWVGTASAQDQPVPLCRASLPCLQQMVDDLRDYRVYLEDQLSLAKSLLTQANQRIVQQADELARLKAAPEPGGKTKPLPSQP